ncbi:MAG: hypothetical protein ACKVOH_05955, partial [Chlamydiales bacterium]
KYINMESFMASEASSIGRTPRRSDSVDSMPQSDMASIPSSLVDLRPTDPAVDNIQREYRYIPQKSLSFFADPGWMMCLVAFFGIVTESVSLAGGTSIVPYLNIASAPLYLVHAIAAAKKRLSLMRTGWKTGEVVEGAFYALAALSSIGVVISDIHKALAGGVKISGLTEEGLCSLIFGQVLPITLVVIGGVQEMTGVARLWRSARDLRRFKEKSKCANFKDFAEALDFIASPRTFKLDAGGTILLSENPIADARKENSVLNPARIQHRIGELAPICTLRKSGVVQKGKVPTGEARELLEQVEHLYRSILEDDTAYISHLAWLEELYEKMLQLVTDHELHRRLRSDISTELEGVRQYKERILQQKETLEKEIAKEIRQQILQHAITVFALALVITASLLMILEKKYGVHAASAILVAEVISLSAILLEKYISRKKIFDPHRYSKID